MSEYKIEIVDINSIKTNEANARQHTDYDIENIMKSIKRFGFRNPIICNKDRTILVGNGRYEACKRLGIKKVPVHFVDMTESEAKAFAIMDNRSTELSSWNNEYLLPQLEALKVDNMLDFTGFNEKDIKVIQDLIDSEQNKNLEASEDNFDVDSVSENKYKVKKGDIFLLGKHRVMCGDSTSEQDVKKLIDNKKANIVFTDPPYGMHLDTDWSSAKSKLQFYKDKNSKCKGNKYNKVIGDNDDFKPELITTIFDNFNYCKEIFIWGFDYYMELIPDRKKGSIFVWDKRSNEGTDLEIVSKFDKMFGSSFELCFSKNNHKREIVRVKWAGIFGTETEPDKDTSRKHPTQKPVKLSNWFITKFSKIDNLIVDLYLGSGSTLIACEQLNRICYGMEIDPHYVSVIIDRYINLVGDKEVYKLNPDGTKTHISEVSR